MHARYIVVLFALVSSIYCDWQLIGSCQNTTNPYQRWIVAQNGYCANQGFGEYFKYACTYEGITAYAFKCWNPDCSKCDPGISVFLRTCNDPNDFYYDCSVKEPDFATLLNTPDYLTITATADQCKTNHTVSASPLKTCIPDMYSYPSAIYACNATDVFITAYENENCQGNTHYQYVSKIASSCSDPDTIQYYNCYTKQTKINKFN
jgi:hypothetical protein